MGNTQAGHRKGSKQVVTVLQSDGRVLEFSRSLRVADLLCDHPKHFVCHSSALVLLQQGKMLPPDAMLMRGEAYFLLPTPKSKCESKFSSPMQNDAQLTQSEQPREEPKAGGTMKFLITKQQLARILAEGSIKVETKAPELVSSIPESNVPSRPSSLRVLHRPSPTLVKRSVTWSPGLESISEVPVM
ncbi:unnamed protein product [Calypogeia fissa]